MTVLASERVSFYSHFFGVIIGIVGAVFLLIASRNSIVVFCVAAIYSFAMLWMFTASAIYHALKREENSQSIWRKFDHLAIFFMIAGTYTPLSYLYLSGYTRIAIISIQWGFVLFGIFFKIFWLNAPRWLYTSIYLGMGWLALIPIKSFVSHMGVLQLATLAGGGVAYTTGAIIYALKKPNPYPGRFGFHEIFHILIVAGAAFHFVTVYSGIGGN